METNSESSQPLEPVSAEAMLEQAQQLRSRLVEQIAKRVFGQEEVVEHLLISLVARGHTLMMGVPGLAKTLLVSTLAEALRLSFNRIQFTPDLMPSDITGTDILEEDVEGKRHFRFLHGPVFSNVLLADEINRAPSKTQAALLQAMQERKVTVGGRTMDLPNPFLVFATQNPVEQEGTYPLPEAQLDRFMFFVKVDYPSMEDEQKIARYTTGAALEEIEAVITADDILKVQQLVAHMEVPDSVVDLAVRLVRASRPSDPSGIELVRKYVTWGSGPRATQFLIQGAKARAALRGFEGPSIEDICALAPSVLRHRILINFRAEADGVTSESIVEELLKQIAKRGS